MNGSGNNWNHSSPNQTTTSKGGHSSLMATAQANIPSRSISYTESFTRAAAPKPVTNGMTDNQFFQSYNKPKDLSYKGGELSIDYGIIPGLRTTKKKKHFRRRGKSSTMSKGGMG